MLKYELGWYSVNGVKYTNKMLAIMDAQRTNSTVEWYFFDDIFQKVNWTVEPTETLPELYKKRALQIREQYDYVILMVSGGADSTNMLYSFLHNNILVDEVVAEIPLRGMSNWEWDNKDMSSVNTASEYKLAQLPLMHEIATKYPTVKTTLIDPFTKMINPKPGEWLVDCQDLVNAYTGHRGRMDDQPHVMKLVEEGKRVAVVMGTDKPVVVEQGGCLFNMFVDLPINLPKQSTREGHDNINRVLFYWTPEMPELVVKMSHVAARAMCLPQNKFIYDAMIKLRRMGKDKEDQNLSADETLKMILQSYDKDYRPIKNNKYSALTVYQRGIVPYIYPTTYDPKLWQAMKPDCGQPFLSDNQDWFRVLHNTSRAMQIIESDFSMMYKSIKPQYLNGNKTGFIQFLKPYSMGLVSNFKTNTNI